MTTTYIALIGDVVASRQLPERARAKLQRDLRDAMAEFNQRWRRFLAARFAVTRGDEFECLLHTAQPVWDIAHGVRRKFPEADWVIACGRGPISTKLEGRPTAPEVDGPCFHLAREALARAKANRLVFTFSGFPNRELDGFASYYSALYWNWTRRQRRAANDFRAASDQTLASLQAHAHEKVVPSALSHLRRRMAWPLVAEGDKMFRTLLETP